MGVNASRAEALLQDLNDYNPKVIREIKKEGNPPLKFLEWFLDMVDQKEMEILEVLKEEIPANLDPLEYEQELNWKRQQAKELANEMVSQLLRS